MLSAGFVSSRKPHSLRAILMQNQQLLKLRHKITPAQRLAISDAPTARAVAIIYLDGRACNVDCRKAVPAKNAWSRI